jgi:hypothetical protein
MLTIIGIVGCLVILVFVFRQEVMEDATEWAEEKAFKEWQEQMKR